MTSIYRDILPSILPTDDILVEDEAHRYVSQERPDGSVFTQQRYQLDKAPIDEVQKVEGEVNGGTYEFKSGQDYELDEREFIDFSVGGQSPDTDTDFYVTYVSQSILDRYIEGHEEEIETVADKRQESIDSRFVDRATGTELEEIGSLFGSLGERRGRDDNEYRIYLKSLVQSFSGRGRKEDLKFAVASAFGSGAASFRINENFEEVEYTIELDDWPPHKVFTVVELLELADPSGVELDKISYNVDEERAEVGDTVNATISTRIEEGEISLDDEAFADRDNFDFDEDITLSDLVNYVLNDGKAKEDIVIDSSSNFVESSIYQTRWEEEGQEDTEVTWNFFSWTELQDLFRDTSDRMGPNDGVLLDENKYIVPTKQKISDVTSLGDSLLVQSQSGATDIITFGDENVIESVSKSDDTGEVSDESNNYEFRWIESNTPIESPDGPKWNEFSWDDGSWSNSPTNEELSNDTNWSFFSWTELQDLFQTVATDGKSSDSVVLDDNKYIIPTVSRSSDEITRGDREIIDTVSKSGDIGEVSDQSNNYEFRWVEPDRNVVDSDGPNWNEFSWDAGSWSTSPVEEEPDNGEQWSFFSWTELENLFRSASTNGKSSDDVVFNDNKYSFGTVSKSSDEIAQGYRETIASVEGVNDTPNTTERSRNSFEWGEQQTTVQEPETQGAEWGGDWGSIEWADQPSINQSTAGDSWSFMAWSV